MNNKSLDVWRLSILLFMLSMVCPLYASADNGVDTTVIRASTDLVDTPSDPELDFGEEGDVILQVYLRDILLTDGMFAIMRSGRIYLPLAEVAYLLDFPIIVDPVYGKATGWFLKPSNTFTLDKTAGIVNSAGIGYSIDASIIFADDFDLYVDSKFLQQWFPLFFDISMSTQTMSIRSSVLLPKEQARERARRGADSEVSFAASREFNVPDYRFIDWPELAISLGGFYMPEADIARYDYRVNAVGDIAFMNGTASFSGNDEKITGATITLGRKSPRGMLGPLKIADYEIGDTSQFLPGLLGNSLSGRGVRLGNTLLANQRDIDSIDLQGTQEVDFEVELYVNDRLRAVDRDSSDARYDFQDIPLGLGQNEIRLEFYGPQGQRYTESSRSFVGNSQGSEGRFIYEFALIEPGLRVFDLFEQNDTASLTDEESNIELSSALTMSYGLTRRTGIALTIASLANSENTEITADSQPKNYLYTNVKLSTDIAGTLLSSDISIDPQGNVAAALAARSARGDYEIGVSQQVYELDYRTIDSIDGEHDEADELTRLATALNISRDYYSIPGGRISYGTNAGYNINHDDKAIASLGTQLDYLTTMVGVSWNHSYRRDLALDSGSSQGQIGTSIRATARTPWSLSSDLDYSDSDQRFFKSGSLRLSRPVAGNGNIGFTASRDLEESTTAFSGSWNKQFKNFRFDSTIAGTSAEDMSLRFGIGFAAKRYPGRWIPTIASTGGSASVAVIVFADDNNNAKLDDTEMVIEGIRLTRNGLYSGAVTDSNGVALMTGLSDNTSVDIGIVETDINEPTLKYLGIAKGVLPRLGRVPVIPVPLQRATDLEGTVTVAGDTPAPNVRMLLTPVGEGEAMEVYTEFDGYYYLAGVPLGTYQFGPDSVQLQAAGLVSHPETTLLVLQNSDDFPEPENFNLIRLVDIDSKPPMSAALPYVDNGLTLDSSTVLWIETEVVNDDIRTHEEQ